MLLLFLPSLLLSIFSTLNFRDVSTLKILYRQPSLIILPTVTYFTFSRDTIGGFYCCNDNNRVRFILEDGEALEDVETTENDVVTPKEDVETGINFCC